MRHPFAWSWLLIVALAVPGQARADKKGGKPSARVLEAEKTLKPGEIAGKLGAVAGNVFTVRVEYQRLELKQPKRGQRSNNNRAMQNLRRQQRDMARLRQQMARANTPRERMQVMRRIQQMNARMQRDALRNLSRAGRKQQNPFKVVKEYQDIEIELDDEAKVRTAFAPFAYDDMGNPKQYTPEELKELKGPNPNLPGFKAGIESMKSGQMVRVKLAKNKKTEGKLRAVLVLIVTESNQPAKGGKKKK